MNYFLKSNKNFLIYSSILLIIIPILGINFVLSFLGNILILLFLIPLLIILILFLGLYFFKSKTNICSNCGAISLGLSDTCMNCGSKIEDISKNNQIDKKPSESIVEVKAEEIK